MRILKITLVAAIVMSLSITGTAFAKGKSEGKGPEKETGNVVSRAAHKAQEEGLKGEDLAEKVHEAIAERKEAHEAEKLEKREKDAAEVSHEKSHKHHKRGIGRTHGRGRGKK